MKERKDLTLDMTVMDMMVAMSEGNPGGLTVIMELIKRQPDTGFLLLCHLDDMNIRGCQIWMGFKDYCNHDFDRFIECIKTRDEGMVNKINAMSYDQGVEWKATQHKEKSRPKFPQDNAE